MKRIILLVITLFIYTWIVNGQNNTRWATYLEGYSIGNVADAGDYLWLSTAKEVYRFEKETGNATHFDFGNLELPTDYSITTIKCDDNGLPWVGAEFTGTLEMTEEGKWILLPQVSTNEFERGTHEILFTENGTVWTSTINMLTRYQGDTVDNFTTNGSISSLAEDNEGNLWIGTANYFHGHYDGLVKYEGENWDIYNSSLTGSIPLAFTSITVDKNGTLWMGGYQGIDWLYTNLVEFDGTSWNVYDPPFHNFRFYISGIAIDDAGTKWLATNMGLVAFDGANWTTYNVSNSGMPSDEVYSILIDPDGTKWIGTGNGLVSVKMNEVQNLVLGVKSENASQFAFYPNPAHDFITLKMPKELQSSTVEILNIQGKVIQSFSINNNQNQLNVSHFPAGIYLVRIQSKEKQILNKFVKQ